MRFNEVVRFPLFGGWAIVVDGTDADVDEAYASVFLFNESGEQVVHWVALDVDQMIECLVDARGIHNEWATGGR